MMVAADTPFTLGQSGESDEYSDNDYGNDDDV